MIKIALDTGCLNANKRHIVLNRLDELEKQGKIKLVTSTVNEREAEKNPDQSFRDKYLHIINSKDTKFGEAGRFDCSAFDIGVFGSEEISDGLEKVLKRGSISDIKPNDWFDFWLLETAITNDCDYFLTTNSRHFIDNGKREMIEELGILVRIPDDNFLKELERLI